ncbi:hypothetical protein ACJX0J_021506, partial [Zea mays]
YEKLEKRRIEKHRINSSRDKLIVEILDLIAKAYSTSQLQSHGLPVDPHSFNEIMKSLVDGVMRMPSYIWKIELPILSSSKPKNIFTTAMVSVTIKSTTLTVNHQVQKELIVIHSRVTTK